MQPNKKVIVTGAAGILGSAYVRALVPHGYEVIGIDRKDQIMKVYKKLPTDPYQIFSENDLTDIRIHGIDLAKPNKAIGNLFRETYAVVMTAANPDSHQNKASAKRNHEIDMNTIYTALNSGCKFIIYLSSGWRLMGLVEGNELIKPDMAAPLGHYGENKQKTVDQMKLLSEQYPEVKFLYNDHGWYPRESNGAPLTNLSDRSLQWWVSEKETQEHILRELEIDQNSNFKGNFHGFIVVSKNIPTKEAKRRGHRPFIFDISSSEKLGVRHKVNVYKILPEYWKWRNIPIYTH